jgi:uncharacterized protein
MIHRISEKVQNTNVEAYRLLKFTMRDVLEQHLGSEEADRILYEAGKLAGMHFFINLMGDVTDFDLR